MSGCPENLSLPHLLAGFHRIAKSAFPRAGPGIGEAMGEQQFQVGIVGTEREPTSQLLPRHIREPRQVQLMRHRHRLRRTVAVLGQNQIGLAATRIVTLERIRAV